MRRLIAPFFLLVLGSVGVACGDVYVDPFTGEASEIPKIAPPVADASFPEPPASCPTREPEANDPCELPGSVCEYGWSADKNCNTLYRCAGESGNGYWIRLLGDRGEGAALCSKSDCPPSGVVGDGDPCKLPEREAGVISDADELVCNIDNAVCACSTGPDGNQELPRRWICKRPVSDCPSDRPLIGKPCGRDLWCDYGACDYKSGLIMQCQNGRWVAGGKQCD